MGKVLHGIDGVCKVYEEGEVSVDKRGEPDRFGFMKRLWNVAHYLTVCWMTAAGCASAEDWILDAGAKSGPGAWATPPIGTSVQWVAADPRERPVRRVMRVTSVQGGGVVYTKGDVWPHKRKELDTCVWRMRNTGSRSVELEIHFLEQSGLSRFWHRVRVPPDGLWHDGEAALHWFSRMYRVMPRWEWVRYMGVVIRTPGSVDIERIGVVDAPDRTRVLKSADLQAIAFPDAGDSIRQIVGTEYLVLTDAPEVSLPEVKAKAETLMKWLREDLAFLPRVEERAPLLLFRGEEAYRGFPAQWAKHTGGKLHEAGLSGFTLNGLAAAYVDPEFSRIRQVWFHELVHAWIGRTGRLADDGSWLQEGLASYYQLRLFPWARIDREVRAGLQDEKNRTPLGVLCNGEELQFEQYWQAATVVRMLVEEEPWRSRLPTLFKEVWKRDTTDLRVLLRPVYGVSGTEFGRAWKAFCEKTYGN